MPTTITRYRVFLGSPSDTTDERKAARDVIARFNLDLANFHGCEFVAVTWEPLPGGVGRPQDHINLELDGCDFFLFFLGEAWGSPPDCSGTHSSGTEEEYVRASARVSERETARELSGLGVWFREVDPRRCADPGPSLQRVLEFKAKLEKSKVVFFKVFKSVDDFRDLLRTQLAAWLNLHLARRERPTPPAESSRLTVTLPTPSVEGTAGAAQEIPLERLLARGIRFYSSNRFDDATNLFGMVAQAAKEPRDRLRGTMYQGLSLVAAGKFTQAVVAFEILDEDLSPLIPELDEQIAVALYNRGFALQQLKVWPQALEAYGAVATRYDSNQTPTIRLTVAQSRVNRALVSQMLGNWDEAHRAFRAVYESPDYLEDETVGIASQVALALHDDATLYEREGNFISAIGLYEKIVQHVAKRTELDLQRRMATAMLNQAIAYGSLGRVQESLDRYNEIIARFGQAADDFLSLKVAFAQNNSALWVQDVDAALAQLEKAAHRANGKSSPDWHEVDIRATTAIALALQHKGERADAIKRLEAILRKHPETHHPALKHLLMEAQELLLRIRSAGDHAK